MATEIRRRRYAPRTVSERPHKCACGKIEMSPANNWVRCKECRRKIKYASMRRRAAEIRVNHIVYNPGTDWRTLARCERFAELDAMIAQGWEDVGQSNMPRTWRKQRGPDTPRNGELWCGPIVAEACFKDYAVTPIAEVCA